MHPTLQKFFAIGFQQMRLIIYRIYTSFLPMTEMSLTVFKTPLKC